MEQKKARKPNPDKFTWKDGDIVWETPRGKPKPKPKPRAPKKPARGGPKK